jgi:hypothetical protein
MFVQRLVFTPAVGKGPEMRDLLIERARKRQEQGINAALSRGVDPTPDGPWFALNFRFPDLSAFQALGERNATDTDLQAFLAKLTTVSARNPSSELSETLIAPPGGPVAFAQRFAFRPATGRLPELRTMFSERVQQRQAAGDRVGLAVTLGGDEGSELIQLALYESLKDFESTRRALAADPATQLFVQRVSHFMTRSPRIHLTEVLVPFKP